MGGLPATRHMTPKRTKVESTEVAVLDCRIVGAGLRQVALMVAGKRYVVTMSPKLTTVDTVTWTSHALIALQAAQKLPR